jgi:hypothetical protein
MPAPAPVTNTTIIDLPRWRRDSTARPDRAPALGGLVDESVLYELVADAVREGLAAREGGGDVRLARRLVGGRVLFEDSDGREAKAVPVEAIFRKITAIREKLRVLEQKLNNHDGLDVADKAELQGYVTRCYGSLTTFNFLFAEEADRFRGTGG